MTTSGHCLCKKTSWSFEGEVSWSWYCHCDDCRRNQGAPVVAWLGVPLEQFTWTGDAPKTFESAKGVWRNFCNIYGSPMGFEAAHYKGGMHIYSASLENPDAFLPTFHVNHKSKLPWLFLDDDLTKYDKTLSEAPTDLGAYE